MRMKPTQDDPDEGGVAEDAEQADYGVQAREDDRHRHAHNQCTVERGPLCSSSHMKSLVCQKEKTATPSATDTRTVKLIISLCDL
jgi:hypothetical protein